MKPKPNTRFDKNKGVKPPDDPYQSIGEYPSSYHSKYNKKSSEAFYYQKKEDNEKPISNQVDFQQTDSQNNNQFSTKQNFQKTKIDQQSNSEFYWNKDFVPENQAASSEPSSNYYSNEQFSSKPYQNKKQHFSTNNFRKEPYPPRRNEPDFKNTDYSKNQSTIHQNNIKSTPNDNFQRSNVQKGRKQNFEKTKIEEKCYEDDCLICLEKIPLKTKIWVCKQCAVITHLNCIQSWLKKLNMNSNINNSQTKDAFSCLHCNYLYVNEEAEHTCFCGKEKNPQYSQFNAPNSCGKNCGKKLNKLCEHLCENVCHSGTCPPCNKTRSFKCYCEKTSTEFQCSQILTQNALSCGKICEKIIDCGTHKCDLLCHDGKCKPCEILKDVSCYCGKKSKTLPCSKTFSCEDFCGKMLECGKHKCEKVCHIDDCSKCETPVLPSERCHCGSKTVIEIIGHSRIDCTEKIPSCQQSCNALLECFHNCVLECHSDDCDCGFTVEKKCRCESQTFKIKCSDRNKPVICKTMCNKKMSCHKHQCQSICCPAKPIKKEDALHLCKLTCNGELSCKKHDCHKKCHKGPCVPCDAMLSRPLYCACQKNVILPPVLCGTEPPKCANRCNKQLPCSHKCYFECHQGNCLPCEEIISKPCECGSLIIQTVKCSKTARCNVVCEQVLDCRHRCLLICHKKNECKAIREQTKAKFFNDPSISLEEKEFFKNNNLLERSCFVKCNLIKPSCGHKCVSFCHPDVSCPNFYCKTMVMGICPCGSLQKFIECGSLEANNKIILECDNKCKNQLRFKDLFDAENESKKVYFSDSLLKFGKDNIKFLKRLEKDLRDMYFNVGSKVSLSVEKSSQNKLQFVIALLTNHYHLDISYIQTDKAVLLDGFKTDKFIIPKVALSLYIDMVNKKEINKNELPFEAIIRFYNLTVFDKPERLEEIFAVFKDKFYLERSGSAVLMYVWKKSDIEFISKELKATNSNWSDFVVTFKKNHIKEESKQSEDNSDDEGNKKSGNNKSFDCDTEIVYKTDVIMPQMGNKKKKKVGSGNPFESLAD